MSNRKQNHRSPSAPGRAYDEAPPSSPSILSLPETKVMRRTKVPLYFGLLFISIFLFAAQLFHAQAPATGSLNAMEICFSNPPPNPSDLNYKTEYLTAAFEVPVDTLRPVPVLEP